MSPLRVRVRLLAGIVTRDPWSPALDGILAAVAMRERLGEEQYIINAATPRMLTPVEGLPLAVERHGDLWWYQVSSPAILSEAGRERRYFHRRFDDHLERYLHSTVGKVMTSAGPYKASRLSDTHVLCWGLEWHAIGDATEIRRLLGRVSQIGARRNVGNGEVVEWLVTEDGDAERARWHRPLPVSFAEAHSLSGPVMPWGLVPPARATVTECVMPRSANAA